MLVSYLGFGGDPAVRRLNINVGRINVNAGRLQIRVKRQCLIKPVGDMQPDVLVYAAVVGVKVLVVPLERRAGRLFLVVPRIVGADGDDIFARN